MYSIIPKSVRLYLGFLVTGLVSFFVYDALKSKLDIFPDLGVLPPLPSIILCFLGLVVWLLAFELSWEWVFRRLCLHSERVHWNVTALAFFRSFLARYLPGKVWYLAARTESLVPAGVSRAVTLRGVLFEQIHFQCATIIAALALLPLLLRTDHPQLASSFAPVGLAAGAMGAAIWLFAPNSLFSFMNRIVAIFKVNSGSEFFGLLSGMFQWRIAFLLFLIVVVMEGAVLFPLVIGLLPASASLDIGDWLVILGAYPVARLIGQLGVAFPAGIGLREGAYVALVAATLDSEVSLVVAVWARLLSIAAELTMFTVFYILHLQRNRLAKSMG